ncbi:MAG: choice-of-anchor L domain-containing protein [Proteobacteria bacterium]|nr:choice-of-anchor L domain-containing protein [Pseudomonadota bacterium]
MKISDLFVYSLICCMFAGCSDDSLVISKAQPSKTPECQGNHCSGNTDTPSEPEEQKPGPQQPETPTDPEEPTPTEIVCDGADLKTDPLNCGTCGHSCGEGTCHSGICVCSENFQDCDGDGACETEGDCACQKGDTKPCYQGDDGTEGVGVCKAGHYECIVNEFGAFWNPECVGQVMPAQDISGYVCDLSDPNRDNDCNGIPDSLQDEDGDGYSICKNGSLYDCCDNQKMCNTTRPDLVHPEVALDCKGNSLDDNCNGITDEDDIGCDEVVSTCQGKDCETQVCQFDYGNCDIDLSWNDSSNNESALLLAKSMDICMGASSDPQKGGLLEYSLHRSGNLHSVAPEQVNILKGMKDSKGATLIKPRIGQSFAMLSSGIAKDVYHGVGIKDQGYSYANDAVPSVYLNAHGGKLESHKKCESGSYAEIRDSVVLHLKMQAPQNAKGFSFDFRFFSREYPFYVCSSFNDFFLTLLTDENGNPLVNADGNISFDENGNAVSVNNAFFTTCTAPACYDSMAFGSLDGACPGNYEQGCQNNHCGNCSNVEELYAYYPDPYIHDGRGGGTAWLQTTAPISGGQIFNLDFYIWDTGDAAWDSSVILDNFQWLCDATLNTGFAPPIDNPIN